MAVNDALVRGFQDRLLAAEGALFAALALLVMIPLPAVAAAWLGQPVLGIAIVSLAMLALSFAAVIAGSVFVAQSVLAFALLVQTMALTMAFAGHPWQIDVHMVYFATLAVIAVMGNLRVLLAAAGLIAVHHLVLSIFMPAMVYPVAGTGYFQRTLFHAAVVIVQTGILSVAIVSRDRIRAVLDAEQAAAAAEAEANIAREARRKAERDEATGVVTLLAEHLDILANQDISVTIDTPLPAQYEALRESFNRLVGNLNDVLRASAETSAEFDLSSKELSASAGDLARRTEQQSQTLSGTAQGLRELADTIEQTASGAGKATETAQRAKDTARHSGEIVKDAVEAMGRIEQSSNEISKIISLIEDISFQTNLLALNAGVEAARAGESGRGFAVVASEVRALAQRTSQAAQGVKDLISKSSQEVENGSQIVSDAGRSLAEISEQVTKSSEMIAEITASVGRQSVVVRGLNDSVQTLDKATQRNAAMCQQMTAMGGQLAHGSGQLSNALSGFRFKTGVPMKMAG